MSGRLVGVGVGPGDPELLTLKAARTLAEVDVVAHFAKAGNASNARRVVAQHLRPGIQELPLLYPVTTEMPAGAAAYRDAIRDFFDESAASVAGHLDQGRTVAVLSEGDPLFYGSYMHLHVRLAPRYRVEVVPGITAMSGCWSLTGTPMAQGDDVFVVLPATLSEAELERRLLDADAAVVMKLGRHLEKVRRVLGRTGRLSRAIYVERGTTAESVTVPLEQKRDDVAPYFSVVLVPGWESGHEPSRMNGSLAVIGLGPGSPQILTPEAAAALQSADALYGYGPYLDRVPARDGQARHASDNREEGTRAAAALRHAAVGAHVAVVSGGDPGVFAMAAAVCEQIERGDAAWRQLDVSIVPGVTAMLAVAARVGAPLGHDFCAISLSDNLKPWELVERRLDAAAGAGFVTALYNPVSRARPWQLGKAFQCLGRHLPASTPVIFGRAIGRADEKISICSLDTADPSAADMATLIIVGSPLTRIIERPGRDPLVYTPRSMPDASA